MTDWFLALATALWLGILTSISPCPLATNIAAISFLGRRMEGARPVLLGGLLYTVGRTLAYTVLAMCLIGGLLAAPALSHFLQKSMNQILGPVLIVVGMFLLGLLTLNLPGMGGLGQKLQARLESGGTGPMWGAFLIGALFALSFCPISAAIFFGSLIPLSVKAGSMVAMPLMYGVGTALPVVLFAVLIALGARRVGAAFNRLTQFEKIARHVTGILFIAAGLYLSLIHIFGIQF
jgi:cytochrome c biogenesis protein CcdA